MSASRGAFHVKHGRPPVERGSRSHLCSGCRNEIDRPGQAYCRSCHAENMRTWRSQRHSKRTAADIVLEKVGAWFEHMRGCDVDECGTCAALFNQVRLAHVVYENAQNPANRRVSA